MRVAASDFSGRTVACRQHILADTICIVTPFVEAGARVLDRNGIALKDLIHNGHHVGVET